MDINMADTGIFATTAEVGYKAGAGASATSKAEAYVNSYMTQVESFINVVCKYNFSDNYAGLNVDVKGILKECASNLAAIYVIQYDMSGYTSRIEAEDMINILYARANNCLEILKDQDYVTYIKGA
jgi:hypothetical protein